MTTPQENMMPDSAAQTHCWHNRCGAAPRPAPQDVNVVEHLVICCLCGIGATRGMTTSSNGPSEQVQTTRHGPWATVTREVWLTYPYAHPDIHQCPAPPPNPHSCPALYAWLGSADGDGGRTPPCHNLGTPCAATLDPHD